MSVRTTQRNREVAEPDGTGRTGRNDAARALTLDALRGVAVAIMVAWHASDAWLAGSHREGVAWTIARVAGGLAAPLFLLASGAAAAMGAARGRPLARAMDRGVSLVAIGHLLNLERWAVDRGAIAEPSAWPALALGAAAGVAALVVTRRGALRWRLAREATRTRARRVATVLAPLAAHVACVCAVDARLLAITLRFDVLHCIGTCGILTALLAWALAVRNDRGGARSRSTIASGGAIALLACAALAVVLAAPHVAKALASIDGLAWIARAPALRPAAPFPLFPWLGYSLAGGALASCALAARARAGELERSASPAGRRAILCALGALALVLAGVAFEGGLPWTRRALHAWPLARPIARLVFHASMAGLIACACAFLVDARVARILRAMGRGSLAIYVLHVPITYGVLGAPIARALSPLACAVAVLSLLLACAVGASIMSRERPARSPRGGSYDAHMFARDVVSTANLRA